MGHITQTQKETREVEITIRTPLQFHFPRQRKQLFTCEFPFLLYAIRFPRIYPLCSCSNINISLALDVFKRVEMELVGTHTQLKQRARSVHSS